MATQLILVPEGEVCNQSEGLWVPLLKFKCLKDLTLTIEESCVWTGPFSF